VYRALRVYLTVEASEPVTVFTGQLSKTLVYALVKNLRIFRGVRGMVSPLHISPLFKPGKGDFEVGEVVTPLVARKEGKREVQPVRLSGEEYILHLGGDAALVGVAEKALADLRNPLTVKIGDNLVTYKLERLSDVTSSLSEKDVTSDRVTVYLKGPVKPFNVLSPSRLPKFSPSAYELLFVAYMLEKSTYTVSTELVLQAMRTLGLLVETWYSLTTLRPVLVPFRGIEPALLGKVTYILDTGETKYIDEIKRTLQIAEIAGVGESRQNGFGTITWAPK